MRIGAPASATVAALALIGVLTASPRAVASSGTESHGASTSGPATEPRSVARENFIEISAFEAESARREYAASHPDPALARREYRRGQICGVDGSDPEPDFTDEVCPRTAPVVPPDCAGQQPVEPLWVRERDSPTSSWHSWRLISGWSCPTDLLPPLTVSEFRHLPLAAPALHVQPDRGWVLVNKPTIVYADPSTQTLHTRLLGHDVTVTATPSSYRWAFGDGTVVTTTNPGHPYPDQDVTHTYTATGTRQIALTVTWTGSYRYDDEPGPDREVDGTAATTATSRRFAVEERRSHLTARTCDDDPAAPGC